MIHHLCLLETKNNVSGEKLENLMVETRIRLLKIPEVNNLRVGKRIDTVNNSYTYFYSFDCDNMDKLTSLQDSAVFTQFQKQILDAFTERYLTLNYEMEPGKDVKYS